MARIALTLAYDGAPFPGWQTQSSGSAIQDVLERALSRIAGHPVATICAGRTDAGVHALRQVVHFDTSAERPDGAWVRGVNALLPASIAVRSAAGVDESFNARRGALQRRYRYLLYCSPVRHPLFFQRAGWTFRPLDADRLLEAAQLLVGEHDFSSFRSSQCQAVSPVRRIEAIELVQSCPFLMLTFVGNAFLHHMIRNIVATLLMVADGRRPAPWVLEVLQARDRRLAAPTFAADGLYLDGARYDPAYGLDFWGDPAQSDGFLQGFR
jgi:tRNA pseudouridine38-40 synthase